MNNITKAILIFSAAIIIISIYILMTTSDKIKSDLNAKVDIGNDFILTDQDGNKFDSHKLRGQITLIYFGFSYCPDICPTSLHKIQTALSQIPNKRKPVAALFISVDPFRDSPNILKQFINRYGPEFIALTGNELEVRETADKFKVYYAKSTSARANNRDYMVDHTSFIYVMDQNFKYLKHFTIDSTANEITAYLKLLGI